MKAKSLKVAITPYWLAIGLSLTLPGCPMSDHYYIDSDTGNAGLRGGSTATSLGGSNAGAASLGGSTAFTTGVNAGAPSAGGSSSAPLCGNSPCSATCCDGVCVDNLSSNPSNCGACSTPCAAGQACVSKVCTSGWSSLATPPASFVAREMPAYVGFGDKLFIFGGADSNGNSLGDGAIYDAPTNHWTVISNNGSPPSPRRLGTAVWTGSVILVCGGRAGSTDTGLYDCATYDPGLDQWNAVLNEIVSRVAPIGIASGTQAAFWGGWGTASTVLSGIERIDLTSNTWQSGPQTGDPGIVDTPAWAFTGQYLLTFGGHLNGTKTNLAGSYTLSSNSWSTATPVTGTAVVSARWGAFGVWDGSAFTVWGGRDDTTAKNDGQTNSTGHWTSIPYQSGGSPTARWAPYRQTGWAFARATGDLLFIGGQDFNGNCLGDGARYISGSGSTAGSWTSIPRWDMNDDHQWGAAAYIGGALVVWGGRTGAALTATGDRWAP